MNETRGDGGPDRDVAQRGLSLRADLPRQPNILDIGCGSRRRRGLREAVTPTSGDMTDLPFADEILDLVGRHGVHQGRRERTVREVPVRR